MIAYKYTLCYTNNTEISKGECFHVKIEKLSLIFYGTIQVSSRCQRNFVTGI